MKTKRGGKSKSGANKGDAKLQKQFMCQYGPDGKVQKDSA